MLSDTPIPTYPYNTAHTYIDAHNRNVIQNPQTHCRHTFLITYGRYSIPYTRQVHHCGVKKKKSVFWRKEKVHHKNEECALCDACVSLQSREKSNRGGEARGGMIVISAVRFEMLRWQISAVSARSDADRYQHTLAITPPPLPPAWALPPQEEVMSQQILNVVS